jgi:hypothetical protein
MSSPAAVMAGRHRRASASSRIFRLAQADLHLAAFLRARRKSVIRAFLMGHGVVRAV